jgi:hypothetical protein
MPANAYQGVRDVSHASGFVLDRPIVSGQFAQTSDGIVKSAVITNRTLSA